VAGLTNDAADSLVVELAPLRTTRRSKRPGSRWNGSPDIPFLRHLGVDRNLDQPPSPGKLACRMQSHACRGAGGPSQFWEDGADGGLGLPFRQLLLNASGIEAYDSIHIEMNQLLAPAHEQLPAMRAAVSRRRGVRGLG